MAQEPNRNRNRQNRFSRNRNRNWNHRSRFSETETGTLAIPLTRAGKKTNKQETHKQNFHGIVPGLSRDCPGTLPAFSLDFLGILFMCFPFSPGKRETHKQFDPHPFPGQSHEVVYVYWFFSPPINLYWNAQKTLSPEEPSETKTGTARSVPCANSNRPEPGPPCLNHSQTSQNGISSAWCCLDGAFPVELPWKEHCRLTFQVKMHMQYPTFRRPPLSYPPFKAS